MFNVQRKENGDSFAARHVKALNVRSNLRDEASILWQLRNVPELIQLQGKLDALCVFTYYRYTMYILHTSISNLFFCTMLRNSSKISCFHTHPCKKYVLHILILKVLLLKLMYIFFHKSKISKSTFPVNTSV